MSIRIFLSLILFFLALLFNIIPSIGYSFSILQISLFYIFFLVVFLLYFRFNYSVTYLLVPAFLPGLAFLWALTFGGTYVSSNNTSLQDDSYLISTAITFLLSALLYFFSFSLAFIDKLEFRPSINIISKYYTDDKLIYITLITSSIFFAYITEPSFKTIFLSAYSEVRVGGDGIKSAGSLMIIFWAFSFLIYLSRYKLYQRLFFVDRFFIFSTFLVLSWLILHARRSEALGIFLALFIVNYVYLNRKKAILLLSLSIPLLIIIGSIRGLGVLNFFLYGIDFTSLFYFSTNNDGISRMPGGMSNIFMTFVNVVHFFSNNDFLLGETFINYLFQILPGPIYSFFNLPRPDYFYNLFYLHGYDYNGGTYLISIFFGNFGYFAPFLFALFTVFYSLLLTFTFKHNSIFIRVFSLFFLGVLFRAYWYDPIIFIKPFVIIFLPLYLIYLSRKSHRA